MKKIYRILLIAILVTASISAKLTEEEVDEYLEQTMAGYLIIGIIVNVTALYASNEKTLESPANFGLTKKELLSFLSKDKYLEPVRAEIKKLDKNTYEEVLEFYKNTAVGKKISAYYESGAAYIPIKKGTELLA